MAVNQALLDQLMKLDEGDRLEVARLLVSSVDAQDVLEELRLRHRP